MNKREEIFNMSAGTRLDEMISETFGAEPEVFWAIVNEEKSGAWW